MDKGGMNNGQRGNGNRERKIEIEFLTPMRLIERERTVKLPEFAPLFARLLERLDELSEQHAGGSKRPADEVRHLRAQAARVRVCEAQTRWVEVFSGSARRGMSSPLSGFVGRAVFAAPSAVWQEILPWLWWGQLVQVGKATVKGNGLVRIGEG